jgi:hypothetical protein
MVVETPVDTPVDTPIDTPVEPEKPKELTNEDIQEIIASNKKAQIGKLTKENLDQ